MSAPVIREQQKGTTTLLEVQGIMLLTDDARYLREKVERSLANGATHVVMDMSNCMYVSPLCATAFGQCHILVESSGGECSFANLPEHLELYLRATGVLDRFMRMN